MTEIRTVPGPCLPEPEFHDRILVVHPTNKPFHPDGGYYGYTTWGSILAMNTRQAIADMKARPQLTRDVLGISPAAQNAAEDLATAHLSLATSILNVLLGLSATLVTTIGLAVVYTRRRAQFIFAARISGWRYPTMFRRLFTFDAMMTTFIVAGVSIGLWAILGSLTTAGVAESPAIGVLRLIIPIAGPLVATGAVGVLVGSVFWCANTIVAAHSADVA